MKEEEAKKKWCPHKSGQYPIETYCIGSDCMMWESWEYEKNKINEIGDLTDELETINKGEGDCGLKSKSLDFNI